MTTGPEAGGAQAGTAPLRVVQVGAGGMGETWLAAVRADPEVALVGVVDLDLDRARAALTTTGHDDVVVAADLDALLERVEADAVLVITTPEAHAPVSLAALAHGLPVLCEKPAAPDVASALVMADAAEEAGRLLMVSQSRRYVNALGALHREVEALGRVGTLGCTFFRGPRFGGFRETMADPLLVDMAIHAFDGARLLLGAEPEAVWCESSNPPWSWYAGDAVAQAVFTFAGGARFVYAGSWCALGEETSWAGRWRVEAERGSARWDGEGAPEVVDADGRVRTARVDRGPEEVAGALAEFVDCVRTGRTPDTVISRNVLSLAMVEAAVRSAREHTRVEIADVVGRAGAGLG